MTYVVRIKNPYMPKLGERSEKPWIGSGELSELVSQIFEKQNVPIEGVSVSWEDPPPPDPFMGERGKMVRWLNFTVATDEDRNFFDASGKPLVIVLAKVLRDEWRSRGFLTMRLAEYADVARQVAKGWADK